MSRSFRFYLVLSAVVLVGALVLHAQSQSTKKIIRPGTLKPTAQLLSQESDKSAKNANSTDASEQMQQTVLQWSTCLSGDTHMQIPIKAGQRYVIHAQIAPGVCDPRGWTWDNGVNWVGPEGGDRNNPGNFNGGALMGGGVVLGSLVGANSSINGGVDEGSARQIFAQEGFYCGSHRDDTAKLDGFIYLYMNDNWTWGDDKGSLYITIMIFQ